MSNFKSLILGSAATLVAFAGAQAADLPVKAKAVQYVKICSLYGAGFYYIPGTETCLKIGGYVAGEYDFDARGSHTQKYSGAAGLNTRDNDDVFIRARTNVTFDTRTATEYGVVRTFYQHDIHFSTGTTAANLGTPNTSTWGGTIIGTAFVQFAGFTFGKAIPTLAPNFVAPAQAPSRTPVEPLRLLGHLCSEHRYAAGGLHVRPRKRPVDHCRYRRSCFVLAATV